MILIHKLTASVLFTIVTFALLLALIYQARQPLMAFIFAILFAYLLNPIVGQFQNVLRCSRGKGVIATYLVLGMVLSGIGMTAGPRVFRQAVTLGRALPALLENVGSGEIAEQYGSRHRWEVTTQIEAQRFLASHRESITHFTQNAVNRVAGLAGSLIWFILIPVMAAFLLKEPAHFTEGLLRLIRSDSERAFCRSLLNDLDAMLARFIRAQLKFATLGLIAYTTFLEAAGFPYALAVGVIAGILEFIPFIGPLLNFCLIMGMAILMGYPHWLMVLIFLAVWRGIQDYIMSPYLMGRGMKLHPLLILCGVLAGGEIAGVTGMFLAVPVLGGIRVVWAAWWADPKDIVYPADGLPLGSPSSTIRSEACSSVNATLET